MRFPGRFADHLLPDRLDRVSLSFLVDDLVIRRGGVAANISYGLGQLGLAPVLVGAAGSDFADYRSWLEQHGVDCTNVLPSKVSHTARFVCTTDEDLCQIASFYPGAMVEAADIRLDDVIIRSGRPDLVLVCADSPAAMMQRAQECRRLGLPYAADPSQQLPRMSAVEVLEFVRGAWCLITNEYEAALLRSTTGCGEEELLTSIEMIVTTLGENGVRIATRHGEPELVPAVAPKEIVDPTGGGDAFRAGFFGGLLRRLPTGMAAQLGCTMAALVLETSGTQAYSVDPDEVFERVTDTYGGASGSLLAASLPMTVSPGPAPSTNAADRRHRRA
ncbi:carbohydrate kinase family protein [Micromonospora chokoriensis]